jgi:hypothetical protein
MTNYAITINRMVAHDGKPVFERVDTTLSAKDRRALTTQMCSAGYVVDTLQGGRWGAAYVHAHGYSGVVVKVEEI